jgi:hypothetical protein
LSVCRNIDISHIPARFQLHLFAIQFSFLRIERHMCVLLLTGARMRHLPKAMRDIDGRKQRTFVCLHLGVVHPRGSIKESRPLIRAMTRRFLAPMHFSQDSSALALRDYSLGWLSGRALTCMRCSAG